MKFNKFGVFTAMIVGAAFLGCSADQASEPGGSETGASVGFKLTTSQGVVITSVNYDLNTSPGGANVADDSIPVPNPDSTISVGINSLQPGSYSLAFSATGLYNGQSVPCVSTPTTFSLTAGQNLTLPTQTLTCTVEVPNTDNTGSVGVNVDVAVEQISVNGNNVEVFSYGPRSVTGRTNAANACVYPPVNLKVFNNDTTITYTWAATPDGALALNALNTQGTYTCASAGSKTLTVTATKDGRSNSKTVTVECINGCGGPTGPVCGDGDVEGTEQCDEATARCVNCQIVPTCGDNVVDAPEECDAVSLPTATCDINCQEIPPVTCGDGTVNGTEQCDNGAANSDTAPNACRTNCTNPSCGDAVVDTGEQCDAVSLPTATCSATCQTIQPATRFTVCETCISGDPDTSTLQSDFCTTPFPGGQCRALEECIINSGCAASVPAQCYCGPDTSANCEADSFVPVGPCAALIRAATGNGTNAETLTRAVQFDNAAGAAFLVISEINQATNACQSACFAP